MNKNKVKKNNNFKDCPISIKIAKDHLAWLKENNFSPTKVFMEACVYLGYRAGNDSIPSKDNAED